MKKIVVRSIDKVATGKRIEKMMKYHNTDVTEVSKALGLTYQCVYRWIKGKTLPDLENLAALCEILGVNIDTVIVRCGDKTEIFFADRIIAYSNAFIKQLRHAV